MAVRALSAAPEKKKTGTVMERGSRLIQASEPGHGVKENLDRFSFLFLKLRMV
jgi:hypothetical protein